MSKTILLAVDAQHYAPEATELARELAKDAGDQVRRPCMCMSSRPGDSAGYGSTAWRARRSRRPPPWKPPSQSPAEALGPADPAKAGPA
jgi:hypothetical protein